MLWAWANRGDPEAAPIFEAQFAEGRLDGPVAAYFEKMGDTRKTLPAADSRRQGD